MGANEAVMTSGSGPDCIGSNLDSPSSRGMTFFGKFLDTFKSQFPYVRG